MSLIMLRTIQYRAACIGVVLVFLLASPRLAVPAPGAYLFRPIGLLLQPATDQPDGGVAALARDGDTLYLAGGFSYIGSPSRGLAMIDPDTGAILPGMPEVNGSISTIAGDGAGGWFIGGRFDRVGGAPLRNLAHIRADRSVDLSWAPNPMWHVSALAVSAGRVFAAGVYRVPDTWSLQSRAYLRAFDAVSGLPAPWNPPEILQFCSNAGCNSRIDHMIVAGDTLLLSGYYMTPGSEYACCSSSLILDTTTGAVRPRPPGLTSSFMPIAASGPVAFVIDTQALRAINTQTGAMLPWGLALNDSSDSARVIADADTLYLAGAVTATGDPVSDQLFAIDTRTGQRRPWAPQIDGVITSLVEYNGQLVALVADRSTWRFSLAQIDKETGGVTTHALPVFGPLGPLHASGGAIVIGGRLSSTEGAARDSLAALSLSTGRATPWAPQGVDGSINALAAGGGAVYVGGEFTRAAGQPRVNLAAYDGSTSQLLPWNPGASDLVRTMAISGTLLYVGGAFTSIGGRAQPYLAAIDTATGLATSWSPVLTDTVTGIAVSGDTVYAASGSLVLALDAATGQRRWAVAPPEFTATGAVVISEGVVYAQGVARLVSLDAASGAQHGAIAVYNTFNPTPSLAVIDGVIYTPTPSFYLRGGYAGDNLTAFDAVSGRWVGELEIGASIAALLVVGDQLVVAGGLEGVDEQPRVGLALLRPVALPYQVALPEIAIDYGL